jgi:hypothetical protein
MRDIDRVFQKLDSLSAEVSEIKADTACIRQHLQSNDDALADMKAGCCSQMAAVKLEVVHIQKELYGEEGQKGGLKTRVEQVEGTTGAIRAIAISSAIAAVVGLIKAFLGGLL